MNTKLMKWAIPFLLIILNLGALNISGQPNCESINNIFAEICQDQGFSIVINGNVYDETNPTGSEVFPGANYLGCDSIINIDLNFYPSYTVELEYEACEIEIDGVIYNETNPSGTQVFTSSFGCDSIINFTLSLNGTSTLEITSTSPASCPDNGSTSACDKTCANSTISYTVPGSQGMDLEWEVLGAESYQVDNNVVTVDWGNPGTGQINVSSSTVGVGGSCALQLNCTQIQQAQDPSGTGSIVFTDVQGGTPPYVYEWSNPFYISPNPSNLPPDTYQVTVTDDTGLSEVCEVTVELACSNMFVSIDQVTHLSCNSGNDGEIEMLVTGGGGGYSYLWSPGGSTSSQNTDLPAGIHCVTVTDAAGCTLSNCFNLCEPPPITLHTFQVSYPSDDISADGSASVQAFGGTPPYTYLWNTGHTDPLLENVPTAGYAVTVTDANGCTASENVTVWFSFSCQVLGHAEIVNMPSSCTSNDGTVSVFVEDAIPPITYAWSDGVTGTNYRTDLEADFYFITISDGSGCTHFPSVNLTCNDNISSIGCTAEGSLCIDIIPEPKAQFSTAPAAVNGFIEICRGESVAFINESTNAENYVWELGDGYATSSVDVTHTYSTSGVFDVLLIARNECFCFDSTSIKVLVSDSEIPEIECIGTVCENESQTYTTSADCSNFIWTVSSNGTISSGGSSSDDYVTVDWGTGPVGEVTLQVSACNGDYCDNPTSVSIPILMDGVFIEGPAKVCPGEIGTYMIPQWSATEYIWSASPFGEIKSGQGSNTVTIKWNVETAVLDPQWVHVEYNNCFLECSGESTKDVSITPDFYLAGPIDVCQGSNSEYAAFNEITESPVSCNWAVTDQDGSTIWTSPNPSVVASIDWPTIAGKYTLTAIAENPDDYCTDNYAIILSVVAGPPPVDGIDGQNAICPGQTYNYQVNSSQPNVAFNWIINNGGVLSENSGHSINVQWGFSPPYELTVSQTSTAGLACESEPFSITIDAINAISLDGPNEVCIENNYQYTAPSFGNATYDWTISPNSAGTILSGQGTDTISVIWNVAGSANLSVSACGASENLPITIFGYPDPLVIHPDSLCSNETGQVSSTTAFTTYNWFDEDGLLVSASSTPNLAPGYYQLEVTNSAGCVGQTTFNIHELPVPTINISTPGLDFFCISAGLPIPTLFALNTDEGYNFEWFRNGVALGIFTDSYTPTQAGTYTVQVNDINGCNAISNSISLSENCGSGGGGGPPIPGTNCSGVNNIYSNGSTCPHGIFLNTSTDYVPGSVQWNFDDPASGANNSSTLENPEHFFTSAGFYGVQMIVTKASGGACILHKPFEVPAQADFDVVSSCPGLPFEFEDLSTFTPGTTITNYDWDFGDPISGSSNTSNLQNPSHIYFDIGSYDVTLTITAQTGCTSSFTKTVNVFSPPTASFQIPNVNCEATGLAFNIDQTPGVTSFEWDFGDPASGAANTSRLANTYHSFSGPGNYNINLTVFNVYGCSHDITQIITIIENDLAGLVSMVPGSPICEGSSTTLTAPSSGTSWLWSDGNIDQSIVQSEAGIFEVTVTNDFGCSYSPPTVVLDIIAQPEATIKVTEYNEYGQPADCFFDGYILCEGEDVFLSINGAGDYSYEWSNGQSGDEVIYDEEHGGTLSVGDHDFEVTVTDNVSGCTSVVGPFSITVNPVPTDIMIISLPAGPICEQTVAVFTVSNPDPQLTYLWSTGEYGNSITASTAGEYFVRGISSFGCEGESNIIEIFAAPDIQLVPDGCHTRCSPDTICLPNIPDVVSFQWYLNEIAIPAPQGTDPDFKPTENGSYSVALFDINGCSSISNPFSIDLLPLDTSSLQLGACATGMVEYAGEVLLPGSVTEFTFTNQYGCDSMITVTVLQTIDYEEDIALTACQGSSIIFAGEAYFPGTDTTLNLLSQFGCDSIINLQVSALPNSQHTLNLSTCTGTTVMYAGEELEIGTSTDFTFDNQFLCDSIVTVIVSENLTYQDTVSLAGCEGVMVSYNGADYPVGTNETFNFNTINGCDSTIVLSIESLSSYSEIQNLQTCTGTFITLPSGLQLAAGTDTTLQLQSQFGCDSMVQIIVEAVDAFEIDVDLEACEGGTANYEGTDYPAGTYLEIDFVSQQGCDSTIFLTVATLPIQNETLELSACTGTTVEYNGEDLVPGTTTEFVLTNQFDCDSTVTVTVIENLTYSETVDIEGCEGSTIIYDGNSYPVGTNQTLNYMTIAGCDSTILLSIAALPVNEENITLAACAGNTVEYAGDQLASGSVTSYTFTNQFDCDSVVVVTVSELPTQNETVSIDACEGQNIVFAGTSYPSGTQIVLSYINQQGCDSIINLNISALPVYFTAITLDACIGSTATYLGMELTAGTTTEFQYTTAIGCDSIVTVEVIAYPDFNFDVNPAEQICWNSNEGEFEIINLSGGIEPFTFSLDGINYQTEQLITNLQGGDYVVYVQDGNGCIKEEAISIPVIPPIEMAFDVPTIECDEDSVIVQSFLLNGLTDSMAYQWQHDFIGPVIPVYNPGTYVLDVSNLCETQSFDVEVLLADDYRGNYIYIPNSFSPNGDGINDIFKGYPAAGLSVISYELRLFDRWGNTLYSTIDIDLGWDGVFKNETMNPGVYVWWLRAKVVSCRDEIDLFEKGDVTIFK